MKKLNFNLRGIRPNVMACLKQESKKLNNSVNAVILNIIEKSVGHVQEVKKPIYHDLDALAGTWTQEDEKMFKKNTEFFEQIDKDIW